MIIPIRLYIIKKTLRDQWALVVSLCVFLSLVFFLYFFYIRFTVQKEEVAQLSQEVQILKERYDTLKYDTSLTENQVKEYNALLAHLIPESEDYFSIIYALEKISIASDLAITDYTVQIGKTNNDKLTLSVRGKGNPESFLAFLEEYQFAGGRLATSEKLQYGGGIEGNVGVDLNFYSKKFVPNDTSSVSRLSKKDLAKLETIKKKIKFQFDAGDAKAVSTDYTTKSNPFN